MHYLKKIAHQKLFFGFAQTLGFFLVTCVVICHPSFGQSRKLPTADKIPVVALNNDISVEGLAKCDNALWMSQQNEEVKVPNSEILQFKRFIRVIVLDASIKKNFDQKVFYDAKQAFYYGDDKEFHNLPKLYSKCKTLLDRFMTSNQLYNEMYVIKSVDLLAAFKHPSSKSGINLKFVDFYYCERVAGIAAAPYLKSSFDQREEGNRLKEFIMFLNLNKWDLVSERKNTRADVQIAEFELDENWSAPPNSQITAEVKKCLQAVIGKVTKNLMPLLSHSDKSDTVRSRTVFTRKSECVFARTIDVDLLNDDGTVRANIKTATEYYFDRVERIWFADTKDLPKFVKKGGVIESKIAENAPHAIFLINEKKDISSTSSVVRSQLPLANSDNRATLNSFEFFAFKDSGKSSDVYPLLQILALSCQS